MNKLIWEEGFSEQFHKSWHSQMKNIVESQEAYDIYQILKAEDRKITPEYKNTFKSFDIDLDKLKVIIVGMSPYPQINLNSYRADGIAFDCSKYGKVSPSLSKLYQAIEDDSYEGMNLGFNHENLSLQYLIDQGVMLTNAALTCTKDNPKAHEELWKPFWRKVFDDILWTKTGLIFILMGQQAQELEQYTDPLAHHILKCEHPVKSSYEHRKMIHNNVFSRCNLLLEGMNGKNFTIDWMINNSDI